MEQYDGLVLIYDQLMAGVDYEEWAGYVTALIDRHGGVPDFSALDLACGTGSTTSSLARRGFRVVGLDLSPGMLKAAADKAHELPVTFMQGDMRDFHLPERVGLVTAFQDGINYLLSETDLCRAFTAVSRAMLPGALFIFDINMVERLPGSGSEVAVVDSDEFTLIYNTSFIKKDIWEISVTGFVPGEDGLYRRFDEVHRERAISSGEVRRALSGAGLALLGRYAAFKFYEPDEYTRRIFHIARKEG